MMDKRDPRSGDLTPPPYNEEDVQVALDGVVGGVGDTATMHDDGRIDIDIDSRLSRTLSKLVTIPPDSQDTAPPPDYIRFASPDQFPLRLNIVIQVVGSRGDVQPFVALGNGLQKYGHRVRLATHAKFESFVHDAGLEFYPIGGDPEDLMSYMVKNPGLMPSMKSLRAGDISRKRQMIVEMLEGCWSSCIEADPLTGDPFVADAIIANPPSFAHMHCAEALGIPLHMMFTMPWTATSSFPHPLANITNGKKNPKAANYLSYVLVEIMTWQGLGDVINDWRKRIGLEPVPNTEGPMLASTLSIPFTYCWSPALIPKPKDWPAYIDVSGFFFRGAPNYTPPKALADFLAAGPPPVYIGFGSIVLDNATAMSSLILEAVTACGLRAIISHGWSRLDGPARPDLYWLDDCPHEWLFQHVSAVVHHGGAGTAACGLRNSRPTVVVPFFGDQPFWGDMIAAAGAGPSPIPHKTLTAEKLADALRFCLQDAAQAAAAGIATQMAKEDGVQAAVLSFLNNLPVEKMRCEFLPDQPASWTVKVNKKTKRISRVAAEILARDEGVDVKNFKPYRSNPILIENHRWDPVTGTTSSALGIGADMFTATSNIFLKPAEEYRRGRSRSAQPSSSKPHQPKSKSKSRPSSPTSSIKSSTTSSNLNPNPSATTNTTTSSSNPNLAANMALASSKSLAHVLGSYTKGILVDLPLATAEGFRSAPRLWNSPVTTYGPPITDAQSGFLVAGKSLVLGLRDGAMDLAREPVAGAKREGFWGGVKGLGRGGGSFVTKSVSAGLGVVAYPGLGISRSLWAMTHGEAGRVVAGKRWGEGRWVVERVGGGDRRRVVQAYYEMNLGEGMG